MKEVIHVITVPSGDYCWGLEDDFENREFCPYLRLDGGIASCELDFIIESPTDKGAFVKKDPACMEQEEVKISE